MGKRSTAALDVDRVATTALSMLAESGLEGISTRRLAERLGVQGPALYYHFRDKDELLGHMAAVIMRASLAATRPSRDWRRWLRAHALASRKTLLRYRDGARVLAASAPDEAMRQQIMPAVAAPLIAAGFRRGDAYEIVSLIAAFTLGFVINEQNAVMRSYMSSIIDVDRGFAHAVDALIAGVEHRYRIGREERAQRRRVLHRPGKVKRP